MGLNGAEATAMPRGANLRSGAVKPGNQGDQVSRVRIGRGGGTQGPAIRTAREKAGETPLWTR